jgi:hypothetical protein
LSRGVGNIRHPMAIAQILPGIVYAVDEGVSVSGLHMGRGNTFWSVISGVNRFRINLNQKGFDPTKQLALNPQGRVSRAVWSVRTVLQQLLLAEAASREHELRPQLPYR